MKPLFGWTFKQPRRNASLAITELSNEWLEVCSTLTDEDGEVIARVKHKIDDVEAERIGCQFLQAARSLRGFPGE